MLDFALTYGIEPASAYVLPALFERSAAAVGMTRDALIAEANRNVPLGMYLAECARKVATEDRAA
jgi:hypothetical protein